VPVLLNSSLKETSLLNGIGQTTSIVSIGEAFGIKPPTAGQQPTATPKPINVKAEIDIAAAAIDSVHQANALLIDQMHALLKENKRLQKQVSQSEQEVRKLRKNLLKVLEREGVAGQVNHLSEPKDQNSVWSLLLLLLLIGGGSGLVYWLFWIRPREFLKDYKSDTTHDLFNEPIEMEEELSEEELPSEPDVQETTVTEAAMVVTQAVEPTSEEVMPLELSETELSPMLMEDDTEMPDVVAEETPKKGAKKTKVSGKSKADKKEKAKKSDDNTLEFEPGLQPLSTKNPEEELLTDLTPIDESEGSPHPSDLENTLEFVVNPEEEEMSVEPAKPVKSSVALDTLLDLARTYIGMDDIESAKQSLQEVIDFGNERQQIDAKELLDQLKRE
jgi:pilus assembly protein FimV